MIEWYAVSVMYSDFYDALICPLSGCLAALLFGNLVFSLFIFYCLLFTVYCLQIIVYS
jgi:predicted CDP-diglyceride synthetase/phosphatidate cytidylyltransferase